ncbi:MAG TPA: hypothetical protein VLF18_18820 [Tahibacter sp.]|uniref:hypothetical protein n=1 Tax=Tahibacter sp. TaxID=2056211 RepID=UPI002CCD0BD8|nr:hypothetical protein [Tahibacter sp.]HSX62241.1 hypothetical protein [Tahibacter sp.]
MMRALVSYNTRNWIDDPATTIAFETGDYTEIEAYPLSNLRVRQSSTVARWESVGLPGSVALHVTFAEAKPLAVVALLGCNFRAANHIANMTVNARIAGTWVEPIAVADNQDAGVPGLPYNLVATMPIGPDGSRPMVDELLIVAEWDAFGAEYTEAARLWAGDAIVLPDGVDAGWSMQVIDTGRVDQSKALQAYEDLGVRVRQIDLPLDGIPTDIAWGFAEGATEAANVPSVNDLQIAAGITGEVLVVGRTISPIWVRRTAIYGRLVAVPRIIHKSGDLWSSAISAIEER